MRQLTIEHVEQNLRVALDTANMVEVDRLMVLLDVLDQQRRERIYAVTLHQSALYYASQGLPVFPLRPESKIPYSASHGCHDATTEHEQIDRWWHMAPLSNVAIATGHVIDVIDIDGPVGITSYASVTRLPAVLGKVLTPRSGGLHLYVTSDGERGNRTKLAEGVDYRGHGGYVVAPPSINEHGKRYAWIKALELT